jgi:hypothetical protein
MDAEQIVGLYSVFCFVPVATRQFELASSISVVLDHKYITKLQTLHHVD